MKKFFILTVGLIIIFCVTGVKAETEGSSAVQAKQWWEDGYVRPPKAVAPAAPVEVAAPTVEESAAPTEVGASKPEEPAAPAEVAAPKTEEPAPPQAVVPITPAVTDKQYASGGNKQDVQNLINKWLTSWQSSDMENYRSCYATDFKSKGQNLDTWVAQKTAINSKNKNIKISIDDLQIVAEENIASAAFIQHYRSSTIKNSGKKILKLKKINNEWKIAKEIM
ncbi:MAG: hypothetical protein WC373_17270 [Smithella sp.]